MKTNFKVSVALLPALLLGSLAAVAQSAPEPKPIQDNSFLVEEAYNQEFGVVQHINAVTRFWDSRDLVYTFTQEWPVPRDARHQLSYTLAYVDLGGFAGSGIGDVALNYRYQLAGDGSARFAFSPRLTLLFPTGDPSRGRGAGGVGIQTSLPFSVVLLPKLVSHWNAGATFVPRAQSPAGERAFTAGYNLGQSFIWLIHPRVNLMLETVFNDAGVVSGMDRTDRQRSLFLSPGVRWAYNFKNGLQIVPGVAAPVGVGPSVGEKGIFLYLSFEHPFRKLTQQ
jgi:hypothetical protein